MSRFRDALQTLAYASELTLEQYELFETLLTPESRCGRPRTVNLMLVLQAILYVLMSGCAWQVLPKEYPPYSTVYYYFRKWRDDGSWKRLRLLFKVVWRELPFL